MQDELGNGNGAGSWCLRMGDRRDGYKVSRIVVAGEVLLKHFDSEQEVNLLGVAAAI